MTDSALRVISIVWMIARIITGELGDVCRQAAPDVAMVVVRRRDAGMGYDGWNAIADEPAQWALDVAWWAYRQNRDADGPIYAISEIDILSLGFDKTNWRNVGNERWPMWVGKDWE